MKSNIIILIIFLIFLSAFIDPDYDANEKGIKLYKNKNYAEASKEFKKAHDKNKEKAAFNYGTSLIQAGKIPEGISVLNREAKKSKDNKYLSDLYFNIGDGYLKDKKLNDAIESFKKSLRYNPLNVEAKYNLELALKTKEENKNKDKNKEKNKDKKDNKENKDKPDKNKKNKEQQDKKEQDKKKEDKEQNKQEEQKPNPMKKGEISKEEADRLLNSFEQNKVKIYPLLEKENKFKSKNQEKDW